MEDFGIRGVEAATNDALRRDLRALARTTSKETEVPAILQVIRPGDSVYGSGASISRPAAIPAHDTHLRMAAVQGSPGNIQTGLPGGEVQSVWTRRFGRKGFVTLFLRFQRPTACKAALEFDIVEQGKLVEAIVMTQGLCILAGQPGDGFLHDADRPAMLVEIPDTGFRRVWNKLYESSLYDWFRGQGLTRMEARDAVQDHLTEARRLLALWVR